MVYLKDMEDKLLQMSSQRDICLYRFLHGQKYSPHVAQNDIESELCFNAFVDGEGYLALAKLRKVKPFKGLHYTNNLVLLIAAAKVDASGEEESIRNYLSTRGYKEQLIINSALGTNYRVVTKLDTPIDILAKLIEENKNIEEKDIQKCLSCTSDIYDYFVLEKGIAKSILQSDEEKKLKAYKEVFLFQKNALRRIESGVFAFLLLIFLYLIYLVVPIVVGFMKYNWDTLEPIAYLVDKAIVIFVLITGVVLATRVKAFRKRIKRFVLHKVYWVLGIDYSEYQKLMETIESE